jgi:hypothetical protein
MLWIVLGMLLSDKNIAIQAEKAIFTTQNGRFRSKKSKAGSPQPGLTFFKQKHYRFT